MEKRKNLSEQLNEHNTDGETLCGINFAIHKNVMIWDGTILQLSNISSIAQYNSWENKEENYYEKAERTVDFKEFRETNPVFNWAFWGAVACFVIGFFFNSFFFLPAIALVIWTAYSYFKRRKVDIDVPQTRKNRICHYMICIIMNSTRKYDFEIQTEEFRKKVMFALYNRIIEQGNAENDIQIDLKNCHVGPLVNAGQVLFGDGNENNFGYPDEEKE